MRGKQGFASVPYKGKGTEREIAAFTERADLHDPLAGPEIWNPYTRTPTAVIALDGISYDDWNSEKGGFGVTSRP